MDKLNEQQNEAVTTTEQATVVLSCPGSGKTKVVSSKVQHLAKLHPNAKICCTTFSKEGAEEMRERIYKGLSPSAKLNITVSTFHSLCFKLVRAAYGTPNMVKSYEKMHMAKVIIEEKQLNIKAVDLLSIIDKIPTTENYQGVDPDYLKAYYRYIELLNNDNKMDFNGLLVAAVIGLEKGEIDPLPFKYLICDEAQDSDILMLRWLRVHIKNGSILTLMLDDDQTLYSFRNSLGVDISRAAATEFNAKVIRMGTNYRSHEEVLNFSRRLITNNINREHKELIAHKGPGGSAHLHTVLHQHQMPTLISKLIIDNYNEWFVLCRTNSDLLAISAHLLELEIPHFLASGKTLFDQEKIANYLGLLHHINKPSEISADMLITTLGANAESKEVIVNHYGSALKALKLNAQIPPGLVPVVLVDGINDLKGKLNAWRDLKKNKRVDAICRQAARFSAKRESSDNGKALIEMTGNILATSLKGSLLKRLNTLEKKRKDDEKNGVSLLTAHSSKGLERENVLIWNVCENTFPAKADEPCSEHELKAHFEEERRILYVAMTRAKTNLHLVFQRRRQGVKSNTYYSPSRYLTDMGFDIDNILVETEGE